MRRVPVISESIASIGYDRSRSTLEVEFNSGEVYLYYDVPARVYEQLMLAESRGRYFVENIRTRFRYVRQ